MSKAMQLKSDFGQIYVSQSNFWISKKNCPIDNLSKHLNNLSLCTCYILIISDTFQNVHHQI